MYIKMYGTKLNAKIKKCVFRMFMDTPEDERTKLISCLGAFRQYWGTLPQVFTHTHILPLAHTYMAEIFQLLQCLSAGVS